MLSVLLKALNFEKTATENSFQLSAAATPTKEPLR